MKIAIASGKGGTGKTTVATNLAAALHRPVTLADCDVEAPNAHLFLKTTLDWSRPAYAFVPEVDLNRCDGCGECHEICRFSGITVMAGMVMTFPEMCHGCKGCMMVCPTRAIREGKRTLGEIKRGTAGQIELHYGLLRVGEAMAPPLIRQVKAQIDGDRDIPVIIDAPPGTSCPAIEAVRDADYVVLVTEPTPFGLNDLVLAVEAVRTLKIRAGLVINRADSGDDGVRRYAEESGLPILMEIPNRREIAVAYARGRLMIDAIPSFQQRFCDLYERIAEEIEGVKV